MRIIKVHSCLHDCPKYTLSNGIHYCTARMHVLTEVGVPIQSWCPLDTPAVLNIFDVASIELLVNNHGTAHERKVWQTLKAHCTQPTDVQQLKAEIALLLNTWDNTTKQQFLDTWVLRIKKLRQLSAV